MNPIIKKLNYKDQRPVAILGAPETFRSVLDAWRDLSDIDTQLRVGTRYVFVLAFARSVADIRQYAGQLKHQMVEDPVFWMAYPKKSSKKYDSDISRDSGWQAIGDMGMEGVRQVAIDQDWSALRFRPAKKITSMKRDPVRAMSKEGKKKTGGE